MNTIPIKRVVVTIDGNRYQIEIPTTMQEQEVFETITTCKRLMAEFYFTALVTIDNYMLLFEESRNIQASTEEKFPTIAGKCQKDNQHHAQHILLP